MKNVLKRIIVSIILLYSIAVGSLYLLQDKLLFHPQKLDLDYVEPNFESKGLRFNEYEEINLEHNNGIKINCQLIPTQEVRKGLVYFLHGNRGNISSQKIDIPEYLDRGYDVFMIDYQGYGKSDGKPSKSAIEKDALLGYDYISKRFKQDSIIVIGHSMGSYAASYCAVNRKPNLLILLTPIYKLKEVITCRLPFLILPFQFANNLDNSLLIDRINCPIQIFISEHDHMIPFESTRKFKKHLKANSAMTVTSNSGHNNIIGDKSIQSKLDSVLGKKYDN